MSWDKVAVPEVNVLWRASCKSPPVCLDARRPRAVLRNNAENLRVKPTEIFLPMQFSLY